MTTTRTSDTGDRQGNISSTKKKKKNSCKKQVHSEDFSLFHLFLQMA